MDLIKIYGVLITMVIVTTPFSLCAYFTNYRAYEAYAADDAARARECFGACAARSSHDWRALYNLGTIAFNQQDYADAIKHFDKALEINAQCDEARTRRDRAAELLKKREQEEQQKKQDEQQRKQDEHNKQKQESSEKDSSQDKNASAKDAHDSAENKDQSSEGNQHNDEQQHKKQQQQEKDKFNQQEKNDAEQCDAQQQQEKQKENAQKGEQKPDKVDHGPTSDKQQKEEHSPSQYSDHSDKIKDEQPRVALTRQEKAIMDMVEETDKAAQHYMMMSARKTGRRDVQKDW